MINNCEFKDCEMSVVVGTDRISGIHKRQWKTKRSQPTYIASTEIKNRSILFAAEVRSGVRTFAFRIRVRTMHTCAW